MKSITVKIHPLVLAAILLITIPAVAIAAGTILTPPVTVQGTSSGNLFTSTNNGSGVATAILGVAPSGRGVVGQTSFNSTSINNRESGVIGQDLSTSGTFNAGVRGISNVGTGVIGASTSGNGVKGTSTKGTGVFGDIGTAALQLYNPPTRGAIYGLDTTASSGATAAVLALSNNNAGLIASGFPGIDAESPNNGGTGIVAYGGFGDAGTGIEAGGLTGMIVGGSCVDSGICGSQGVGIEASGDGVGISAQAFGGCCASESVGLAAGGAATGNADDFGVYAASPDGIGAWVESDATPSPGYTPPAAFMVQGDGGTTFVATTNGVGDVASIDGAGNMILAGTLTQTGTPLYVSKDAVGQRVGTYGDQQTQPTVEDAGEAALSSGQSYVRLDPAFRRLIDPASGYLVFITSDGDANTLFVSNKSMFGFSVTESRGGRSNIVFDYRIMARPIHAVASRLPVESSTIHRPDPRILQGLVELHEKLAAIHRRMANEMHRRRLGISPHG